MENEMMVILNINTHDHIVEFQVGRRYMSIRKKRYWRSIGPFYSYRVGGKR